MRFFNLCISKLYYEDELTDILSQCSGWTFNGGNTVFEGGGASIITNSDRDKKLEGQFPDGFLYFPFFVQIEFDDNSKLADNVIVINGIIEKLWNHNLAVVVSSHYEHLLLKKGGYKDESLPWPE